MGAADIGLSEEQIRAALREVIDPEIGVNIVDLGLIYGTEIGEEGIVVRMTVTSPACPLGEYLSDEARNAILRRHFVTVPIAVDLVFDPPWRPEMMSDEARRQLGWSRRA